MQKTFSAPKAASRGTTGFAGSAAVSAPPSSAPSSSSNMLLLAAHVTLLTYAEAYLVVAEVLVRLDPDESIEERECVNRALKLGHQAYLQLV